MADEQNMSDEEKAKLAHRVRTSTADELLEKRLEADEREARSLFISNMIFMVLFLGGVAILIYALGFEKDEGRTLILLKVGIGTIVAIPAALLIKSVLGMIRKK